MANKTAILQQGELINITTTAKHTIQNNTSQLIHSISNTTTGINPKLIIYSLVVIELILIYKHIKKGLNDKKLISGTQERIN